MSFSERLDTEGQSNLPKFNRKSLAKKRIGFFFPYAGITTMLLIAAAGCP